MANKYKIAVIKYTKICHLGGISSNVNNNKKYNYFILWHKMGWSKLYYTQAVHNKLIAKLRAIRNIIKRSLIIIYSIVRFRKVNIADLAVLNASIAYLIGKKAFDRNDRPNFEIKI